MNLIHLSFVFIIIANSRAEDAPTSTVSPSSDQTTEASKSTFDLTTTSSVPNATKASTSNFVEDVGKMLNSFATIAPIPIEQLFGPIIQPSPIPTIDINKILKSLPNIPPIQIPTIDSSFFASLPTLPPLVLPTIDPDFFKNFPTLAPIQIPTIDPDFFKNLPTIAPIQLPTIDPDFFKNIPTLPPLPTLDPNIFKGWPTLPPFKLPESPVFGNAQDRCIPKLLKFSRDNVTFQDDLKTFAQQGQATNAVLHAVNESKVLCTEAESGKLAAFVEKHKNTFQLMDQFSSNFSEEERLKVFQWLITENSMALTSFSTQKGLQNMFNPSFGIGMMNLSLQISTMQMELLFQPI
ncbi:unnamed protein product [Auanema sp. JU1783]|nr:unnamed protein product [Auanema sp. JU1783]